MIKRLVNKIKFFLNPPKNGDVYYGDALNFIISKPVEYGFHGLKDGNGQVVWSPVPAFGSLRLTVKFDVLPTIYYGFDSEVLCSSVTDPDVKMWKSRREMKRIRTEFFKDMVINGILRKGEL